MGRVFLLLTLSLAWLMPAHAERPKIALVLSGGGAKGAAHIGIIKVLEEQRIPVDIITGTSMGAYVAGMYALGLDADELERQTLRLDWNQGYQDRVTRDELSLRRKRQNDEFLLQTDIGVDQHWQLSLPGGFFQGQAMGALLRQSTLNIPKLKNFDRLPIPYRAVATDMETVTPVVLKRGHLASAMQASMSVPGVLQPVELNGRLLADGGVVNNMPVDVAKEMGADVVIAVDIGDAMLSREQLDSALAMVSQLTNYLTRSGTERQKALMGERDILISPPIGGIGVGDFNRLPEIIALGEAAARAMLPSLSRLSLSENEYHAYQAAKLDRRAQLRRSDAIYLDRIEVNNNSGLSDEVIKQVLGVSPGQFHQARDLEKGIRRLYALDAFDRVTYQIEERDDEQVLTVVTNEKDWGPGFVDLKFALEDNFSSRSNYEIGAQFRRTNVNMLGGEWLVEGTFGSNKQLATEFYTPLDSDYDLFWKARGEYEKHGHTFFFNRDEVADSPFAPLTTLDFDYSSWTLSSELGINLQPWSELALGLQGLEGDISTRNIDSRFDIDSYGPYIRLSHDTLDNVFFPTRGTAFETRVGYFRNGLEVEGEREVVTVLDYTLDWLHPVSLDRHTLVAKLSYGGSDTEQLVPVFARSLGGLFNLSGYQSEQLSGRYSAFGGLLYHYRWFDNDFGAFRSPVYVGGSLEQGGVWESGSDIRWQTALTAGSVFIGVNTNLGPLYLAYGQGEGDNSSFYLYFGNLFSF